MSVSSLLLWSGCPIWFGKDQVRALSPDEWGRVRHRGCGHDCGAAGAGMRFDADAVINAASAASQIFGFMMIAITFKFAPVLLAFS